jgi:hypothetical protein
MNKAFAILIALLALGAFSAAQAGSTDQGSKTGTSDQGTKTKKSTKGGASTITGCLSGPSSEGTYELKSGKKTVEVGGNDDLSKHVGHEVKLHGSWSSSSDIGEKEEKGEAKKGEEKGERHFKVASIDHISDTCKAASGASKKKKESGDTGGTTPK